MKSTAFLIRISICLLLSFIPLSELENHIYSSRMHLKNRMVRSSQVVIIEVSPSQFRDPARLQALRYYLSLANPKMILQVKPSSKSYLLADSDGVIRRATLEVRGQPSLASVAYDQLHGNTTGLGRLENPHLIQFFGPDGKIPTCDTDSIIHLRCRNLKNKILLLTEPRTEANLLETPVGEMDIDEILANDIQTVVNHETIHMVSLFTLILITLGMILLGAFYIIYFSVVASAIAITTTGVAVVIVLFQLIFNLFNVYIPSANVTLSLLVTYLIFTGYRLALQENLQWRSLKQAQYLRELDRMKTNFLSLVSHDLKTPLAKIQAVAERMKREIKLPLDERSDWNELIDSIENSNNEMKHFIASVLNLSRIESQKVILNKKSNDINLLIGLVLKRLKPLAQQKGISIDETLEPLFSIECDEDLLRQVLTNLIDNAIKYSPNHSRIIVRSIEKGGHVHVEVEDFGPGIPKDQLPLMFRKFSRLMRPMKDPVKGTGLGLYLSKYFIELHGGSIRVKSVEGRGTTFSFSLPVHS